MGDQPVVADLAELVDVVAAVVWTEVGEDHPVGARLGGVRPGDLDVAGGQVVAGELRPPLGGRRGGRTPVAGEAAGEKVADLLPSAAVEGVGFEDRVFG